MGRRKCQSWLKPFRPTPPSILTPYGAKRQSLESHFILSLCTVSDEMDILGSGAFGVVHKGRINGVTESVAFKKPNKNISVSQLKNLLSEIKIMIYIGKHENIVVLLGAYTEQIREGKASHPINDTSLLKFYS